MVTAKGTQGDERGCAVSAANVSLPDRLVDRPGQVRAEPGARRRTRSPARFHVKETGGGKSVSDALVYAIGLPYSRVTVPGEVKTDATGWATMTFKPAKFFPRKGYITFFVRARKAGDDPLAGVSTRRLVQLTVTARRVDAERIQAGGLAAARRRSAALARLRARAQRLQSRGSRAIAARSAGRRRRGPATRSGRAPRTTAPSGAPSAPPPWRGECRRPERVGRTRDRAVAREPDEREGGEPERRKDPRAVRRFVPSNTVLLGLERSAATPQKRPASVTAGSSHSQSTPAWTTKAAYAPRAAPRPRTKGSASVPARAAARRAELGQRLEVEAVGVVRLVRRRAALDPGLVVGAGARSRAQDERARRRAPRRQ